MAALAPTTYRPRARRNGRTQEVPPVYADAGPAKLARQAALMPQKRREANQSWIKMRSLLEARLNMMRSWRYSWMTQFQLLEAYILPQRGIFINATTPTPNTMQRGVYINQNILDPTGTKAMRVCSAGLMSALMSPGRPWFKLKPALQARDSLGKDAERWFDEVEDRMYHVMAHSNFYQQSAQMFEDLTTFATSPMIIYEDEEELIRCYLPCPGEYLLSSGPTGEIDGLYRQFNWTVDQIVSFFGLENCPPDVQSLWQSKGGSLEVERIVCHALEPNFPIQVGPGDEVGVVEGGFTWREAYWIWGAENDYPLSLSGFWETPAVIPRWATTSNDPYGRGIGMDNLGDIMQLQVMTARMAEAIEKLVRPPMKAHISLKNQPSSVLPGHLTYVADMTAGIAPIYTVNPQIREMMENIAAIQERIKAGFLNDMFLMLADKTKQMTAYEVAEVKQEGLQVLGPVEERWQTEFASPAIKRIFNIMQRKRLIPTPPRSLATVRLGVEYVSMMALAQKASATASMERFAQVVGNLAPVYPEAKFALNPVGYIEEYGELIGVPPQARNSVAYIKAQMALLAKQAAQQQSAQAAMGAVNAAQQLSQTDLGGGRNALNVALGMASGGSTGPGVRTAANG
jgi:Bacteriophage head to tail connecting protein